MTVEQYIKENAYKLGRRIHTAPNIPQKKLEQIRNSFAGEIPDTYIVLAGDATLTGNGSTGFAFSGCRLYFADTKGANIRVELGDIDSAEFIPCGKNRSDNMYLLDDEVRIYLGNGGAVSAGSCLVGFDCLGFADIINGIASLVKSGVEPVCTKQIVSVSAMSDYAKEAYVETLCNYACLSGNYMDPDSYSLIQNVIVRIEIGAESRCRLREYMQDPANKIKTGYLIKRLIESTDFGVFEVARFSLVQDVLSMHEQLRPDGSWRDDGFIGSLINALRITPAQVEILIKACRLNYRTTHSDSDLADLQSEYGVLQREAVQYGIPLLSIYCSGTAYSIDTYWSIFGGRNKKQVSIDKQRELMLQEMIKNNQKTVNNLVEDMNEISGQLIEELQKGMEANEKIKQLAALLGRLKTGAAGAVDRVGRTERLTLENSLPRTLDENILKKARGNFDADTEDIIGKCYEYRDGTLTLISGLSTGELTKVYRCLSDIGYPMDGR